MRIVVNHLTRMQKGVICVAGVDLETRRHVRPIPASGVMSSEYLARHGGPFDMARIVELDPATPSPHAPHTEDYEADAAWAKALGTVSPAEFWTLLDEISRRSLQEVFGPELRHVERNRYGVEPGRGSVSLGCFCPRERIRLHIEKTSWGAFQVRTEITDGVITADVAVTDVRLFGEDHLMPDPDKIEQANRRLDAAEDVLLSVGLTRKYPKESSDEMPSKHWLQVNNLHFQEDPLWPLG